jgi:hypothetical protein
MWRQDLSRSIDYLQTRKDIDPSKLGYLAHSLGAEIAPMLPASTQCVRSTADSHRNKSETPQTVFRMTEDREPGRPI